MGRRARRGITPNGDMVLVSSCGHSLSTTPKRSVNSEDRPLARLPGNLVSPSNTSVLRYDDYPIGGMGLNSKHLAFEAYVTKSHSPFSLRVLIILAVINANSLIQLLNAQTIPDRQQVTVINPSDAWILESVTYFDQINQICEPLVRKSRKHKCRPSVRARAVVSPGDHVKREKKT